MTHRASPHLLAAIALGLAGCAGGPPVPDWKLAAYGALDAHTAAYLSGRDRAAAAELAVARRETARTGDADQMARVELTVCAAQTASLAASGCPAYASLAVDAGPRHAAYARYLAGQWAGLDSTLLPDPQRGAASAADAAAALGAIGDPLSRLVAAGAAFRAGRLSPVGIAVAIDTAATQGWRRPLLAWLGVERERLQRAGDEAGAAAIARRMDRVTTATPR